MQKYILIIIFMILSIFSTINAQWEHLNQGMDVSIGVISIDPYNENNMLVSNSNSLYYSTNAGTSFKLIKTPPDWSGLFTMRINKGIIYISEQGSVDGFYISEDTAKTWKKIKLYYLAFGDTLQCGTIWGNRLQVSNSKQFVGAEGFYYSIDNFKTWQVINRRITKNELPPNYVLSFTFNDSLIISSESGYKYGGLFITKVNGLTWLKIDSTLNPNNSNDTFLDLIDSKLFYSVRTQGTYRSENFGQTWTKINSDFSYFKHCNQVLYTITGGKLFYSIDYGNKWIELDSTLYDTAGEPNIAHIGFNAEYFYVALYGQAWQPKYVGLYRTKIKDCLPLLTDIEELHLPHPEGIYPNPATEFIEISLGAELAVPEQNDVRICDVFGQTVLSVGVQNLEPLRIDVSSLAPGMYFVRIGDKVSKFVKL